MNTMTEAKDLKTKGNTAFKNGDYATAVALYSAAIDADPSNHIYYLNRSMANLKLDGWSQAEEDATKVLELSPKETKAYYRRAVARREQGNFSDAQEDIKVFSELGGASETAKKELAKIPGFRVADAGAKVLGAFALRPFHRGDLIIAEPPLFSLRDEGGNVNQRVLSTIRDLPPEKHQQYVSLHNAHAETGRFEDPLVGIFWTNAFQMDADYSGVFAQASRFNHSCSPNARYSWNPAVKRLRIYALRDIACGDEILVSYLSSRNVYGSTRAARRARLSRYAFTCACSVCDLPEAAAAASDRRRTRITELWESIPHFPPGQTRNRLLAVKCGIHLLEEEGYAADYDDFTNDAAAICGYHSDWASAKYWAARTYESRVAEFGEDSYRADEVKAMFLDPKSGPMAGMGPRQKFDVRL